MAVHVADDVVARHGRIGQDDGRGLLALEAVGGIEADLALLEDLVALHVVVAGEAAQREAADFLTAAERRTGDAAQRQNDDVAVAEAPLQEVRDDGRDQLRLAERGAFADIKPMPGRVNIPTFSPLLYGLRNLVERFFSKIKHFRAIATRYEKHDANYLALVKLAAIRIWMRAYESVT